MVEEVLDPQEEMRRYNEEYEENRVREMRAEIAENAEKELKKAQLEARNLETQRMTDGIRSIPALQAIDENVAAVIALYISQLGNEMFAPRRGDWDTTQTWMMILAPIHWVRAIAETAMYNVVTGVSVRFLEWREWKSKQS